MSDISQFTRLALDGVATIAQIIGGTTAETAVPIVAAIKAVVGAIDGAAAGTVTPDEARAAFRRLRDSLARNDSDADAALAAHFPVLEPGPGAQAVHGTDGTVVVLATPPGVVSGEILTDTDRVRKKP